MNKDKIKMVGIIALVIALVAGTFVGNIYFNIPIKAFPYVFSLGGMILVGIGRMFKKGDEKPLPEPSKENIRRAKIAGCAGLTGLGVIIGIGVGFETISYFEKAGRQLSIYWMFGVLIGVPSAGAVIFLKKRSSIIKEMSNTLRL